MNTERKVKVPLEPKQMESNAEGRGGTARYRPMEAVGAARSYRLKEAKELNAARTTQRRKKH